MKRVAEKNQPRPGYGTGIRGSRTVVVEREKCEEDASDWEG